MKGWDIDDVVNTMPGFIKKFHENFQVSRGHTNWSQHIDSYLRLADNVHVVKYEEMLDQPHAVLSDCLSWYNIEAKFELTQVVKDYSFENQTNRQKGEENRTAFLRKGIAGDWKNYFNKASVDLVHKYYGSTMKRLGYA